MRYIHKKTNRKNYQKNTINDNNLLLYRIEHVLCYHLSSYHTHTFYKKVDLCLSPVIDLILQSYISINYHSNV